MAYDSPERQRTLRLQERVFEFAAAILTKCPCGDSHPASRETWRNLVRSAPSASYNLEEADEASSDADFIAKMKIALREAKESRQAIRFIIRCKLANHTQLEGLEDEARQISSIFAAIIINKRKSMAAKIARRKPAGV
jgi:four helix bundle protein